MGQSLSYVIINTLLATIVMVSSLWFICRADKTPIKQRGHAVLIGCMASIGVCIAEIISELMESYTCGAQIIHLTIAINLLGIVWCWRCLNLVFAFAMTRHHYADHVQQTRHHRIVVHPDRDDLSSRGDTLVSFPSTIDTSQDDDCLVRHRSWRASWRMASLLCIIAVIWCVIIIILVASNGDELGAGTRPLCDESQTLLIVVWCNGLFFVVILALSSWQLRGSDSDKFEIKRELRGTAIIAAVIAIPLTISGFAMPLSYQRDTFHVTTLIGTILISMCNCYATAWPVARSYHHEHNHDHAHHTRGHHQRHHTDGGTTANGARSPNYGQSPSSNVHGSYGRSTTSTTATPAVSSNFGLRTPHGTPPGAGHTGKTRQIYRDTSARDLHAAASVTTLTELLATDEGTNSFRRYLAKEFSIENLSFVTAVQVFTALASSASRSQEEVVASALSLYRKYVVAGAPFQVNLSGAVTRRIRDDLKPFMPTKANRSTMAAPLALVLGANGRASLAKNALASPTALVAPKPATSPKAGNGATHGGGFVVSPTRPPTGDARSTTNNNSSSGRPPTSGGNSRISTAITVTSSSSSATSSSTPPTAPTAAPASSSAPPLSRLVSIPTLVINIPTNDGVTTTTVSSNGIAVSPKASSSVPSPKGGGGNGSGRRGDIGAIASRRSGGTPTPAWQPHDYKASIPAVVTVTIIVPAKKLPLLKPSIFFEAQQMIMGVLSSDVFPRYLKSPQYREYCRTINNQ